MDLHQWTCISGISGISGIRIGVYHMGFACFQPCTIVLCKSLIYVVFPGATTQVVVSVAMQTWRFLLTPLWGSAPAPYPRPFHCSIHAAG